MFRFISLNTPRKREKTEWVARRGRGDAIGQIGKMDAVEGLPQTQLQKKIRFLLTEKTRNDLFRTFGFQPDRFTELELYFIEWLRVRSLRTMKPGWEGYYAWFHKPMPAGGTDFGQIHQLVRSEGHFPNLEAIALQVILDWDKWEGEHAQLAWSRYWLGLLANVDHMTPALEQQIPGADVAIWLLLTQRLIGDHSYYVPAGLFMGDQRKQLIRRH